MKKSLMLVLIAIFISALVAEVQTFDKQVQEKTIAQNFNQARAEKVVRNNPADFSVVTAPQDLITTYYDYFPGSYASLPIRVQTPEQGGIYLVFHGKQTPTGTRREWYSYVDQDGNVIQQGANISTADVHEGYAGVDLDPITGDPFVAWHANNDADGSLEVVASYDDFALFGSSGLWSSTFTAIDNPHPIAPRPDTDEFIWPYVQIAPSPMGGNYSRVFVIAENSGGIGDYPAYNVIIAYADIDFTNSPDPSTVEWNYTTIDQMNAWDTEDVHQTYHTFIVSDDGSKVAIVGWYHGEAYVFLNENYGEGDFEYIVQDMHFYYDNPQTEDGNYTFMDGDVPFDSLYVGYWAASHINAEFNGNNEIVWTGNMTLRRDNPDGTLTTWQTHHGVKETRFNLSTHTFDVVDITPVEVADDGSVIRPNYQNGIPCANWDVDEDGAYVNDTVDSNGDQYVPVQPERPFSHHTDNIRTENNFKTVADPEHNLVFAIWTDGKMAYFANQGYEGYEDWAGITEIAFAVSNNNGATWSEPTFMNGNPIDVDGDNGYVGGYVPELDGMIPVYVYPGDKITDIEQVGTDVNGDPIYEGTVHLMFLDDYVYGSSITQQLPADQGGMMKYMAIRVKFDTGVVENDDNTNSVAPAAKIASNYPNPFNPTTTIKFNNAQAGNVKVSVYNVRGQLIKTLANDTFEAGTHTVTWNGTDNEGNKAASGVYFYKVETSTASEMNKMLMLK